MTCQDCELFLAQGELSLAAAQHVDQCPACRSLQEDLSANAAVLDGLRDEQLPPLKIEITPTKRVYGWAAAASAVAAAAAILLMMRMAPRPFPAPTPTAPVVEETAQPPQALETAKAEPVRLKPQRFEPLKIKMLTPDPDVVIYWLIDN